MTWNIDRAKSNKRKKKEVKVKETPTITRFDDYIQERYKAYQKQLQENKEAIQRDIQLRQTGLKRIINSTSRGHIRERLKLEKECKELETKLQKYANDSLLREFEATLLPYAQAYEREHEINCMKELVKPIPMPNETESLQAALYSDGSKAEATNNTNSNNNNHITGDTNESQTTNQNSSNGLETSQVFKNYLEGVENQPPEVIVMHQEICDECDEVMVLEPRASVLMCPYCSNWKPYLDATSSHMAYGEEVEFTSFAYLRLNHFNERLTYSQAKESNQIPEDIIKRVMQWLYENRITKIEDVTLERTYHAMKELKLRAYYKQNTQLWCRITGNPPLRMTPELEEQLRLMFKAVSGCWNVYRPANRKNFLSYNYCLYKFIELLGYDDFLPYFKLLKGPKKLQVQDQIFAQICADPRLNWTFIPSKS